MPPAVLFGLFLLLGNALLRKLGNKPLEAARLRLSPEEMHRLERASAEGAPVSINGSETLLRAFDIDTEHVHPTCGSCPDELHLSTRNGTPALYAAREPGETVWNVTATRPILWGLLGHVSQDLRELRTKGTTIGKPTSVPS